MANVLVNVFKRFLFV